MKLLSGMFNTNNFFFLFFFFFFHGGLGGGYSWPSHRSREVTLPARSKLFVEKKPTLSQPALSILFFFLKDFHT